MQRGRRGIHTVSLIAFLALGACSRAGTGTGCAWPPGADTAGWQVVDVGPVVLKLPREMREHPAPGYLGLWSAGDRALALDYGPRAPDPRGRPTGGEQGWSCETELGGRRAVVRVGVRTVRARSGEWQRSAVAEAWWPSAGADSARLLVIGWGPEADSARVARDALTAARGVRFRTVFAPGDSLRQLHRFCAGLRAQADRPEYRQAWDEWRPRCPAGPPPPPPDYESVR